MESATIEQMTELELNAAIIKLQQKRSKELKKSLAKIKRSYVYETILEMKKQTFQAKKESGKFTPEEVAKLIKAGLIKK